MSPWECNSCKGVYPDDDNYYHACPEGTKFARDENIDDSHWHPHDAEESKKPRPIKKGKKRKEGGARKVG